MLDQNLLGQASTQCDPRPTDPTNQIRTTPYLCDQCVFTKAHFSQPLTRCRRALQTAYPDFRPCPHITQIKSMPTRRVAGRLHSVNLPLLRLSCKSELSKSSGSDPGTGVVPSVGTGAGRDPKFQLCEPAIEHQINKNTRYRDIHPYWPDPRRQFLMLFELPCCRKPDRQKNKRQVQDRQDRMRN